VQPASVGQAQATYWADPAVTSTYPQFLDASNPLAVDPGLCPENPPFPLPVLATPTPTPIPRIVEPQAQAFHDRAQQFGLPLPFTLWPVTESDLFQNGYGPNRFAYDNNCATPIPFLLPTVTPTGTTGSNITPDPCPYRQVNSIHPGIDYYTGENSFDPISSPVIALCDGIIVPGASSSGGSAQPTTGSGLSLRCFANDPRDPDGDGQQNVSNIVVVYNHLTLDQGIVPAVPGGPYQVVRAGALLASTTGYTFGGQFVQEHLDLQVYIAYGYQTGTRVQLNPRLMFSYPQARPEAVRPFAPGFDQWSLQGRHEQNGLGRLHYWTNTDNAIFIEDMASYLESVLFSSGTRYIGPNCIDVSADNSIYPITCTLDRNDIAISAPPTPSGF